MGKYQITADTQIPAVVTKTQGLAPLVGQVLNHLPEAVIAFVQANRYERTARTRSSASRGRAERCQTDGGIRDGGAAAGGARGGRGLRGPEVVLRGAREPG